MPPDTRGEMPPLPRPPADPPRANEPAGRRSARTVWDGEAVADPAAAAADRAWTAKLMPLLGRLEFGRTALARQPDPAGGLRVAAVMVHDLTAFVEDSVDPRAFAGPVADVLASAGGFLAGMPSRTSPPRKGLLAFFRPAPAGPDPPPADPARALRELPLVCERVFTLLGSCFRGPDAAIEWVKTSGVFLTELKRALASAGVPAT